MRTITCCSIALAALLAGCTSSSKGLSVSASSRGTAPPATTASAGGASTAAIDAGNGLTIERLRLVVQKVELEGAPACAGTSGPTGPTGPSGTTGPTGPSGTMGASLTTSLPGKAHDGGSGGDGSGSDDGAEGGECEIEGGPFLVDLSGDALTGPVHWVATVDVPFGTYEELKFKVNTIPAEKAGADAGLQAMAAAHASIMVDGLRKLTATDGTTTSSGFTFKTSMAVSQKREGAVVVADGANVTLDVDPSGWFKAADGSMLDPTDPAAQGAIEANIRASIRVLQDDDHDGHDDSEHGPGHD